MFRLQKWYFDVVTAEGTALVAYAAGLHWGAIRVGYCAALLAPRAGSAREQTVVGRYPEPARGQGTLEWSPASLRLSGRWESATPPIHRMLLQCPDGTVHWRCHMPCARALIRYGDRTLEGLGYVEHLVLTIPPWRLPFRTLRWGRHASPAHSIVWIEWSGGESRRWIWLDGREQHEARLTDTGITGLDGGTEMRFEDSRAIRDRRVLTALGDLIPGLGRRWPGRLGAMHEHKLVARSSFVAGAAPLDQGWSMDEVVTW